MTRSTVKPTPVHEILAFQLNASTKTQKEIAKAIGYKRPNVLSMMKKGDTRIPLDIAPKLAKEIGLDPWHFTERCIAEYDPDLLNAISQAFGCSLSENERAMLKIIREASGNLNPAISTKEQAEALDKFARSLL